MPLDFRYHLASLAAVFGALIIGMLLGVAMKEGPALSNQVNELKAGFRRAEVLKDIDRRADAFNLRTESLLVRDRLQGRRVAIVLNSRAHSDASIAALRTSLAKAGATIAMEVTLKSETLNLSAEEFTALYQKVGIVDPPQKNPAADLMRRLGQTLGTGNTTLPSLVKERRLVRIKGAAAEPFSLLIFYGGQSETENNVKPLDVPFLQGCVDRGVRVVAAEAFDTPNSAMRAYQKVAPFTVDNLDRAAGRIALILAAANGEQGHFGYKSTAAEVAPDIE